jgi:hypothetical protein
MAADDVIDEQAMSPIGTKRARAYATDVRSWWKLTYERSGGIRVLTHSCQSTVNFAVVHNARQ